MRLKNPPAFPVNYNEDGQLDGMTMRDYFAAKAFQALLGNSEAAKAFDLLNKTGLEMRRHIAACCYQLADCMLEERAKEQ